MKINKHAIVTGGSSGIGLAIVQKLSHSGWNVTSWDLQDFQKHIENTNFVKCDVSNETSVKDAYKTSATKFGACSLLVNNCGLQFMSPIEDFPIEKWNLLMGVLLTGTFLCTREVAKDMRSQRWGRVINVSSIHGKVASPFKSAYVAAKHGVLGFAKVAAMEFAPDNITVNSICPGFVDTPLMRNQVQKQMELNGLTEAEVLDKVFLSKQDIKQLTSPDQIADLVMYLSSDSASTITGEAFNVSGGWGMGV